MPNEPKPTNVALPLEDMLAASSASDWRQLEPEDTLYIDFELARVVIELAPAFAPLHVSNIRKLAREGYWDGLAVVRVNDNYVVQLADPLADDPVRKRKISSASETLPPEFDRAILPGLPFNALPDADVYAPAVGFTNGFPAARSDEEGRTWLVHRYGTISAGREVSIDSGSGAELTAVIGHAPRQLDRNVTVVGCVRQGMEFLSSLPRGAGGLGFFKGDDADLVIKAGRMASDVPVSERSFIEVLRTDTPFFARLIESRRNRYDEWFHKPAGRVDIGNVPVPVRTA